MTEYNRKDYMAKKCDHHTYYVQFATPAVFRFVTDRIGADRIRGSECEHFNDIPLGEWDRLHGSIINMVGRDLTASNGNGGVSLSDTVCIAKSAARLIRGF